MGTGLKALTDSELEDRKMRAYAGYITEEFVKRLSYSSASIAYREDYRACLEEQKRRDPITFALMAGI